MSRCPSCNGTNADDARFCSSCGARLTETTEGAIGARKVVTVVFADVVESTSLVERLEPETARRVLDRYYECMREEVDRHGGRVEKFIGDAVMAVFGVPVAARGRRAPRRARGRRDARGARAAERRARQTLGVSIQMRIGVATGEVVTGTRRAGRHS